MKNITVSLDDDLYRRARMIAAERDERLKREQREIRNRITTFRASDGISRDELHDRRL